MQPQGKPSLESIFGAPQRGSMSPVGNSQERPSLSSLLGTQEPEGYVDKTIVDLKESGTKRIGNVKEEIKDTFSDMKEAVKDPTKAPDLFMRPFHTALRVTGQGAGFIGDAIGSAVFNAVPDVAKEKISSFFETPAGQEAIVAMSKGMDYYNKFKEKYPEQAKDLEAVVNIASVIPVAKGGQLVVKEGVNLAEDAFKATAPIRDKTVGIVAKTKNKVKDTLMGGDSDRVANLASDPEIGAFVQSKPQNVQLINNAVKQGFEDKDIKFLATLNEADKPAIKEMTTLANLAEKDARVTKRPIDVVGDNGVAMLRKIQGLNATAGEAVDRTARELAGEAVDAKAVHETAIKALERAGVSVMDEGEYQIALANAIAQGDRIPSRFDFSASVFKKFPSLQKKLDNAFSDLPTGEMDAYELHKFKKSLDEFKDYEASGGKGLTTTIENLIGEVRHASDSVLDTKFSNYNLANTDFKATRELLDEAHAVVGKNTDFLTKNANLDFGQAMRSAFSNNKSRGRVLTFLENLDKVGKQYKIGDDLTKMNILDQALYSQILEGVYGTPAVTGLAGEVGKAIKKTLDFADRPVGTTIDTVIEKVNKMQKITPEEKKKLLEQFIQ